MWIVSEDGSTPDSQASHECCISGAPDKVSAAAQDLQQLLDQFKQTRNRRPKRFSKGSAHQNKTSVTSRGPTPGSDLSPTLGDLLQRAAPGRNAHQTSSSNSLKDIEGLTPRLSTDPIASIIQNVGASSREHEWVRLRGFSVHATKEDVLSFMNGIDIDNDDVKAEYDEVRRGCGVYRVARRSSACTRCRLTAQPAIGMSKCLRPSSLPLSSGTWIFLG